MVVKKQIKGKVDVGHCPSGAVFENKYISKVGRIVAASIGKL
jgi:hypothetical protein